MVLNVGDKLYFNLNRNNRHNNEVRITSVTIEKVGRKYYKAKPFDTIDRNSLINVVKDFAQYNTQFFISEEEAKKHYELLEFRSSFYKESDFHRFIHKADRTDLEIVRLIMNKYK